MGHNILITGAAGYIGGTVLQSFISRTSGPIKAADISAAVRSEEQVQSLSKLGVNVVRFDLRDEAAVAEAVLQNKIDLVVHTATSFDSDAISSVIKALGQRRKITGEDTYYIHSSVTAAYTTQNGWPPGEVKDTDLLYEKERRLGDSHPVRKVNIVVTEEARAQGVTSFNIPLPTVYGRGTGQWRKLSVQIPAFIRASISQGVVHKFDVDGHPPAVHVSDLAELYALMVETILQKKPIPSGETGYYFGFVHRSPWWDVMDRIANGLYARGLVSDPKVQVWPNDDMAANNLGFPRTYVRAMCTHSGELVPINAYKLGWQPEWDQQRYLESIEDEIQALLELDTVKTTLFDTL